MTIISCTHIKQGGAVEGGGGEDGEEEDEAELIRKALESDDIDEDTIKRILEAADKQQDVVELDLPGVKKLFLNLEKKIQSNLMKRVKFADEPNKFVDSELELFEEIGNFKVGRWIGVHMLFVKRQTTTMIRQSSSSPSLSLPFPNTSLQAIAAAPSLYPELVKLDVANSLLGACVNVWRMEIHPITYHLLLWALLLILSLCL